MDAAAETQPLANFSVAADWVRDCPNDAAGRLAHDGLLHVRGAAPRSVAGALRKHVDEELARRRQDSDPSWFGDVYGYEDTGKRWDLKLFLTAEVAAVLSALLGALHGMMEADQPTWRLTELAAMCTVPGDPGQPVHADTSHIYDQRMLTVFFALHDIQGQRGPTCMYPRTHADGELHMGERELDASTGVLCTMECGDCVVMDSRLLHHGTPNTSPDSRHLFYTSWCSSARRSRGSTNTLLEAYEDRHYLRNWREWLLPPAAPGGDQGEDG